MKALVTALPLLLLAAGTPIFVILLVTAIVALYFFMHVPLTAVPQMMFGSLDKVALLAVPFFIFAGEILSHGGLSQRLIRWVESVLGGVRGSLALTTVGTCEFFGAISGSSPATVAAIGRTMYPALRQAGYDERFSLGLLTSGGAIASIIPPSILMILYGAAAEQSVARLFVGGFLPGILIGLLMAAYIVVYARRRTLAAAERFSWARLAGATREGIWALAAPVIILGSIYGGICTPTETAGIACIYGVLVTRFIYREIGWRQIFRLAVSSAYLTAQIMIIVGAAGVFSWLLTVSGVPQAVVRFIEEMQITPAMLLLAINILLLVVGCFIDPSSAVLVLTPLLVPIVRHAGIDLVHFGIIVTVNLSIGMFTPPFGLNIFVSQSLFKVPMGRIVVGVLPFLLLQLIALLMITYVPWFSLYLGTFLK
ncbi:MAG: TRAP transporter large permease [Betaproteobacteria bacterium]|nr:TRAP transporter large permease [Betaproteobacteria bacterium]